MGCKTLIKTGILPNALFPVTSFIYLERNLESVFMHVLCRVEIPDEIEYLRSSTGREEIMLNKLQEIREEIAKVIIGKENVTDKILMAVLAKGHILLEDVPGVGKTTTALCFSKILGLDFRRIQFTPDVVPSDVTGFTMYDREKDTFVYRPGAVMCNLLLADEINRTSSKTQSALLEVMEEGHVTVDGKTYPVPQPFTVFATQNPIGTTGTQVLPESQLDRFMVKLSMGYPDRESQVELLRDRQKENPLDKIRAVLGPDDVNALQEEVKNVYMSDPVLGYITDLTEKTRNHEMILLGISPRGALAMSRMARACAYLKGRDYVVPEDVQDIFYDVCAHRLLLSPKARLNSKKCQDVLGEILKETVPPKVA